MMPMKKGVRIARKTGLFYIMRKKQSKLEVFANQSLFAMRKVYQK
jgi:hypothetical protein